MKKQRTSDHLQPMTLRAFARLAGVSHSTASRWCNEGMPHHRSGEKTSPLKIDPRRAIPWLVNRQTGGDRGETHAERLVSEKADKIALDNQARRSQLVMRAHVEESVRRALDGLDGVLGGMAERLAPEVSRIAEPATARAILLQAHREARSTYAEVLRHLMD
jgi:phage terminase Nu1 subunit (DNA packaging protein)